MINIAIIEDDLDFRGELETYFKKESKAVNCAFAVNSMEAFFKYYSKRVQFEMLLVDIRLPGMSGIKGVPKLRRLFPHAEIIMLTTLIDGKSIYQSICAGANGYLIKNLSPAKIEKELIKIKEEGGAALSPLVARKIINHFHLDSPSKTTSDSKFKEKEKQIIRLVVDGNNYKDISEILGISTEGVRYHVRNIYQQLQVKSKSGIIRKYLDGFFDWF